MKTNYAPLLLVVLVAVVAVAQDKPKPFEWPKIKSVEGPCLQIVGKLCFNAYAKNGGSERDTQGEFGYYSFDDPDHKVTTFESLDCLRPNARHKWGSANPSDPDSTVGVVESKYIVGLYRSCYGDVKPDKAGNCPADEKPFSCTTGECCP
jgi:hypothetical protein